MMSEVEIWRSGRGYYMLYVHGEFAGNYDTYTEATKAYEEIVQGKTTVRELLNA